MNLLKPYYTHEQSPCIFPKLRFSPKQQNSPWVSSTPPTPDAFSSSPLPSWIVVATDRPPINKYLDWGGNNTGGGEGRGGGGRRYILHCTYVTGAGSLPFTPLFRSIRSFALPHTTYIPCLKHSSSVRAKKSALTNLGAFLSTGGKWEIRVLCSAVPLRSWKNEPCSVVSGFGRGGGRSTSAKKRVCLQKFIHPHAKGCKFGYICGPSIRHGDLPIKPTRPILVPAQPICRVRPKLSFFLFYFLGSLKEVVGKMQRKFWTILHRQRNIFHR